MPRLPIDYFNTIIYKLCCNDPSITDIYIGHTTDFTNRKRSHKCKCNTENCKGYNLYVYQFIREHGGWDNWSIIEIEKINCIDSNQARTNERRYIELLGATLNSRCPSRTKPEYYEDNKEQFKEINKKYREEHKEQIKKYREENKEKSKQYREEHTEQFKVKRQLKNKQLKLQRLENINK